MNPGFLASVKLHSQVIHCCKHSNTWPLLSKHRLSMSLGQAGPRLASEKRSI